MTCRALDHCVVCGGARLEKFLDLGSQPLANSFHAESDVLPVYPLGLNVCLDCWHVQQLVAVDPREMFDRYDYVSGTSKTLAEYFDWFVSKVEKEFGDRKLLILEIGANDGTLLRKFQARGHLVVGVDPAENLRPDDIPWVSAYWSDATASYFADNGRPLFDCIIAMNVLAHTAEPVPFLAACKKVLAPSGRIYVQTSQAFMIERGEFDTVYHEHISFFSLSSFAMLAQKAEVEIANVMVVPIHGMSHLVQFAESVPASIAAETDIADYVEAEGIAGRHSIDSYLNFADLAKETVKEIHRAIEAYRSNEYGIIGYGAAAKGMTFINYADINLDYVVDDNPLKVGKLTPGRNIPVVSSERLKSDGRKLMFLILAWNFRDEIIARIKSVRPHGDDIFVSAFPWMRVAQ